MQRATPAIVFAALVLCGCQPKVIDIKVNIVVTGCDSTPLNGVTFLKVRVLADDLPAPMESVASVSVLEPQIQIPQIPAGKNRVIEVRGYAGEPSGGQVKSIGRSLPFEVPTVVAEDYVPLQVNVFLRQVDTFSMPSKAATPANCSRMLHARAGHTATLLPDGRVFIAGGYQQNSGSARSALYKAEFFNPGTGAFEEAPDVGVLSGSTNTTPTFTALPRAFHTATLLPSGQVLLWMGEEYLSGDVNGSSPQLWASVLVYDLAQEIYMGLPIQNLNGITRARHGAAIDANGKVLIVGGVTRALVGTPPALKIVVSDKVEWYDLATATAHVVDAVSLPRKEMSVQAVQGGAFIAAVGGSDGTALKDDASFFSYQAGVDPPVFTKVEVATPPRLREPRRLAGQATMNGTNDLIVMGGYSDPATLRPLATTEIVSTKTSFNVADGPPLQVARGDICAVTLKDGRVLAIGGRTVDVPGGPPRSDGTVDLVVAQSSGTPVVLGKDPLKVARYNHTCTLMADGSVLVLGGVRELNGTFQVLEDALIYTPAPTDP
ncbi:MAG: kelch repeat-containing protein [Myxococcaceae bacterium]